MIEDPKDPGYYSLMCLREQFSQDPSDPKSDCSEERGENKDADTNHGSLRGAIMRVTSPWTLLRGPLQSLWSPVAQLLTGGILLLAIGHSFSPRYPIAPIVNLATLIKDDGYGILGHKRVQSRGEDDIPPETPKALISIWGDDANWYEGTLGNSSKLKGPQQESIPQGSINRGLETPLKRGPQIHLTLSVSPLFKGMGPDKSTSVASVPSPGFRDAPIVRRTLSNCSNPNGRITIVRELSESSASRALNFGGGEPTRQRNHRLCEDGSISPPPSPTRALRYEELTEDERKAVADEIADEIMAGFQNGLATLGQINTSAPSRSFWRFLLSVIKFKIKIVWGG